MTTGSRKLPTVHERPRKVVSEEAEAGRPEPDETIVRPLNRPTSLGDVIGDKYRLMRALGRGGMGRIFAADHLLLGTTVALKFMHPHLAKDRGQVSRFKREARAAATLKSAHVARIIDVDQLPGGELYIVMEYLEGTSLETMVDGKGLPIADAVLYTVQACDALAEAHSRSIIHRDVKPANMFLTKGKSGEPLIKVLDFGLAKSLATAEGLSHSSSSKTLGGQALGTPYYMSPEQLTGDSPIDGRSDVWAIGATLYELLTGHLAFGGPNAALVFDAILKARPAPIRNYRPDLPDALVAIVDRCLTPEITGRFQTVRELAKALESCLAVTPDPVPFVAAPLHMGRFVRQSAPPPLAAPPPAPPPPEPSVRAPYPSIRPPSPSFPGVPISGMPISGMPISGGPPSSQPDEPAGPSTRQMLIAAMAGPVLIAIVAGVVAVIMMKDGGLGAEPPRPGVPNEPVYLTARKADDAARAKAPAVPEKPERPRK